MKHEKELTMNYMATVFLLSIYVTQIHIKTKIERIHLYSIVKQITIEIFKLIKHSIV